MNKTKEKFADSSDDSDQDYIPSTKRSKSTNSSIEREDMSETEQRGTVVEGARIDSLWNELKHHSSSSVDPLGPGVGISESDNKVVATVESPQDKDKDIGNKAGSSLKKSRVSQLLSKRTEKKREKPASILHSSKVEWEGLKAREELSEELTHHNKDGFLKRQDFLKRCEEREHDNLLESRTRKKK